MPAQRPQWVLVPKTPRWSDWLVGLAMSSTSSGQPRNVYANDANVELINAVANNEQARVFFGFPRSASEAARHNLVFRGMQRAGDFAASALRYIGWRITPGSGPPEQRLSLNPNSIGQQLAASMQAQQQTQQQVAVFQSQLNQTREEHANTQLQLSQTQAQLGHQDMLQQQLGHAASLLQQTQSQLVQREAELRSAKQRMAHFQPDLAQIPAAAQMTVDAIQGSAQLAHMLEERGARLALQDAKIAELERECADLRAGSPVELAMLRAMLHERGASTAAGAAEQRAADKQRLIDELRAELRNSNEKLERRGREVEAALAKLNSDELRKLRPLFDVLAPPTQSHLQELLEDQAACRSAKGGYCHWHASTLDWCASVYLIKPSAYEQMATGDVLVLPSVTTLKRHSAQVAAHSGHSPALLQSVKEAAEVLTPKQRQVRWGGARVACVPRELRLSGTQSHLVLCASNCSWIVDIYGRWRSYLMRSAWLESWPSR